MKIDSKDYITGHGARRDTTTTYTVFGSGANEWVADEAPIGFFGGPLFSVEGRLAFGGAISTSRDSSKVRTFTLKEIIQNSSIIIISLKQVVSLYYQILI